MIQTQDLLKRFLDTVDLPPDEERHNGVFLGTISITDKSGLDGVLSAYTTYIDKLLDSLPLSSAQYIELLLCRCFTYDEYCQLWDMSIKPKDYDSYMIFKVLLIQTEQERNLFTSVREASHEDFVPFLKRYTGVYNPYLHHLIYETYH